MVGSSTVQDDYQLAGMTANSTGFDLGEIFKVATAQIFHATVNDTFPTNPLIALSPSFNRFKLDVFPKSEIQTKMYYGKLACSPITIAR
jgi:hypothetical protein